MIDNFLSCFRRFVSLGFVWGVVILLWDARVQSTAIPVKKMQEKYQNEPHGNNPSCFLITLIPDVFVLMIMSYSAVRIFQWAWFCVGSRLPSNQVTVSASPLCKADVFLGWKKATHDSLNCLPALQLSSPYNNNLVRSSYTILCSIKNRQIIISSLVSHPPTHNSLPGLPSGNGLQGLASVMRIWRICCERAANSLMHNLLVGLSFAM